MLSAADELILLELTFCIDLLQDMKDAEMQVAMTWKRSGDLEKWDKHRHAAIMLGTARDKLIMRKNGRFEDH